jgi:hypothetical protein
VTTQALDIFDERRRSGRYFWLGLAPEGTRKYVPGLRSGFYRTALAAGVPLGLVRLDYGRREVTRAVDFIALSGDTALDMARMAAVYQVPGRRLGQAAGRAAAGRRHHHDPGRRPVFERAGCGFSHVRGPKLPPSATQHRPELAGAPFEAMGVSLVFHPRNPYVPTVHMNVRMIAAGAPGQEPVCWFGGGMDLTPYYGFEEDAVHFHRTCRDALAPFGDDKYPRFKTWCDEYFYLKHRNEQRGVGGVFFDDFSELGFDGSLAMMQAVGDAFLERLPAHRGAPPGHALWRARARLPALPPRPLCRVQPGVGPGHALWPAVGRAHRIHPAVHAAAGQLGLPAAARARLARGALYQPVPGAQGLGLTAKPARRPVPPGHVWRRF